MELLLVTATATGPATTTDGDAGYAAGSVVFAVQDTESQAQAQSLAASEALAQKREAALKTELATAAVKFSSSAPSAAML